MYNFDSLFEELPEMEEDLRKQGFAEETIRHEIERKTVQSIQVWQGKSRVGGIIASHTNQQQIAA